jgi:hypothetical protein
LSVEYREAGRELRLKMQTIQKFCGVQGRFFKRAPGRRRHFCVFPARGAFSFFVFCFLLLIYPASFTAAEDFGAYLLMKPIANAFAASDFTLFRQDSTERISVHFDPPFDLHGYFYIDKFIDDITGKLAQLETQKMVWVSRQLEEQFAVQSLNLIFRNKRSDKTVYYKLIFFLTKKNQEWKIYYLRGLKI